MKYVTTEYKGCDYLTAGKKYEYKPDWLAVGTIIDDEGDELYICLHECFHIDTNPWTLIDDTTGENE